MHMGEGLDKGDILFQEKLDILENENSGSLHDRLALMSGGMLVAFLRSVAGETIEGTNTPPT